MCRSILFRPLFSAPTPLKSDLAPLLISLNDHFFNGLAPLKSEERCTVQNYAKIKTFIY